mgnify:CR=1 FL=1
MNRLMHLTLTALMLLPLGAALAQPIGDPVAGEAKSQACIACHGAKGASDNPAFPKLAGQHPDYLLHALQAYRSGERNNAIMNGQAAALSDQDMRDLAAYYGSLEPALRTPVRDRASR